MWQRDMVCELKLAKPAERRAIVDKYRNERGYSYEHMMRIARQFGFSSDRKTRSDKGIGNLAEEQIDFVATVLRVTRRENKGAIMPVENALEFAIDNGIIQRDEVSVSTLQRNLRERQMNSASQNAPTPHTEMRSLHPNHVHEVDVSTCIQYYLDKGGMAIMPEDEFYKNKLENYKRVKDTLQRYIMADHFTGFYFVKYYVSGGETAENLFDFCCSAWEAKADSRMPFRGVPQVMLMDGGCRAKAKAMGLPFWEGLNIDILPGLTGNSRRQGSVEVTHNIWEKWFETRLRIDPASSLEVLNRRAFEHCAWFNATRPHTRHGFTRMSLWLTITREQLRELPARAELVDLLNKPEEERTVSNGRISFQTKEFSLRGLGIPHGAKVMVIKNLYKWQDGIVEVGYENQRFELKEIAKLSKELGGFSANSAIIGQEYKGQKETATQQANKRMDELAYGNQTPNRKKETPFPGLNAFEGNLEKIGNLTILPKRGTAIEVSRPAAPIQQPIMELFKQLRSAGIKMTAELNKGLRAEFGDSIDSGRLAEVVEHLTDGTDWRESSSPARAQAGK